MNDTIQAVATLISTLGFPIVGCGALFWKINKQDALHKEEIAKLSDAINNNTSAMMQLVDKLHDL